MSLSSNLIIPGKGSFRVKEGGRAHDGPVHRRCLFQFIDTELDIPGNLPQEVRVLRRLVAVRTVRFVRVQTSGAADRNQMPVTVVTKLFILLE